MKSEDYIIDKNYADAIKAFEIQRHKMYEVLARTYDLGQINVLELLISAVESGTWTNVSYEKLVAMRDSLKHLMESDSNMR